MSDWRDYADAGEWRLIEWEFLDEESQLELLDRLRQTVPRRLHGNLMEEHERHDTMDEALAIAKREAQRQRMSDVEAKKYIDNMGFSAAILMNLEAVYGEEIDWRCQAKKVAEEALAEADVTGRSKDKPTSEFSRHAHAEMVIERLDEFDTMKTLAIGEADGDEEKAWLAEIIDDAARIGYWAGRRTQAVWGKPIEVLAVTGEGVLRGVRRGGNARRGKLGPETAKVLDAIVHLVERGHTISNAATIAFNKYRLGASASANRQLYYRHQDNEPDI